MSFTITNARNNSSFTANDGETILDAALRDNRIYPYGCRSGVCGACKADLINGNVDYGDYEEFALTDEDIQAGKILLCQACPQDDVTIDADEVMTGKSVEIKMLPCRVGSLNRLAEDVMQVYLTLPKTQNFSFIAGQYIDILLKDGQRRSFSIANLPEDSAQEGIELHIRRVDDGHFTPRIFNSVKERDLLRFEGPFGTYFLQSEPEKEIIMIAGGTGFAPIKGLISQLLSENPDQPIHFFWGARDEQDLYLNDLVNQWMSQFKHFNYTPVLSDSTSDTWNGEKGFVHQSVANHFENFSKYDVYASGPPVMIESVRNSLTEKGLNPDRFFFDSFDYAIQ